MEATKCTFLRRVTAFLPSAALTLIILMAAVSATAQTNVFVPGNASGYFGNPADIQVPLVAALSVSGPGMITVTYVSGTITDGGGGSNIGPNGVPWSMNGAQSPLEEALGGSGKNITNLDALIGVFVPQARVQYKGFNPIDGTKNATRVGILPSGLFFIGMGKTFSVNEAGTLYLGINDWAVSDNSGGFNVTVTGP